MAQGNEGQQEEDEVQDAYPPEGMKPNPEFAGDVRSNPRGIRYLYLASAKEAAMAEVRPWVGSYISLASSRSCVRFQVHQASSL